MAQKHSVHAFIACVTLRQGEPREIHFDAYQCVPHGFNFIREDGSATFIGNHLVDEIEVVRATPPQGSA